jgi:hypothetical protein
MFLHDCMSLPSQTSIKLKPKWCTLLLTVAETWYEMNCLLCWPVPLVLLLVLCKPIKKKYHPAVLVIA